MGISDKRASEKLQLQEDLTLTDAIEMAIQMNKSKPRWPARLQAPALITSGKNKKVDNRVKIGRNRIRLSPRTSVAIVDYHTMD